MNKIRDDFPDEVKKFFNRMKDYLDTDLYFYGSVVRADYQNGSDIDIAVFTDNESSTITKLQCLLHAKRSEFDKVVWKLYDTIVYGFKIKCTSVPNVNVPINFEIAVYNNNFKDIL